MTIDAQRIREVIERRIGPVMAIYVFGSLANGAQTIESDVDLAVLSENGVSGSDRWQLAGDLAQLLGRDVDLVDLRTASTVMRSQVIGRGRPLYRLDDPRVEAFEDFVYADYARLNEERSGILADIAARGSIHGG